MTMWRMIPGFVCAAVLVSGCGRKASETVSEKIIEAAIEKEGGGKVKVDLNQDSYTVTGEKGSTTVTGGKSAKVPESFPADVYVYKGAKVESSMEMPGAHSLALTTKDEASKVVEIYKKEMTGKGWKQEAAFETGEQVMLTYKKDKQTVMVSVTAQQGGAQIGLTVAKEE